MLGKSDNPVDVSPEDLKCQVVPPSLTYYIKYSELSQGLATNPPTSHPARQRRKGLRIPHLRLGILCVSSHS